MERRKFPDIVSVLEKKNEIETESMGSQTSAEIGALKRRMVRLEDTLNDPKAMELETKQSLVEAHGRPKKNDKNKNEEKNDNDNTDTKEGKSSDSQNSTPWASRRRSLIENRDTKEQKMKLILIQKVQAEQSARMVATKEKEVSRLRRKSILTNVELANVSNVLMNLNEKEVSLEQELNVDMDNEKVRRERCVCTSKKKRINVVKEGCR